MKITAEAFKAVFHPNTCVVCGEVIDENEQLCDYCHEIIVRTDPTKRCIACGVPKKQCQCNKKVFCFDGVIAPFVNCGAARRAMHIFKFRKRQNSAVFFGEQMALAVKNEYRDISFDGITYVPMSKRHEIRRGYNQSRLLAEKISKILSLPIYDTLGCSHSSVSQHNLKFDQRMSNVKGRYTPKLRLDGRTVLLVDDIKTTGATLNECSKQLLRAGADSVYCVTALISEKKKNKKQ